MCFLIAFWKILPQYPSWNLFAPNCSYEMYPLRTIIYSVSYTFSPAFSIEMLKMGTFRGILKFQYNANKAKPTIVIIHSRIYAKLCGLVGLHVFSGVPIISNSFVFIVKINIFFIKTCSI